MRLKLERTIREYTRLQIWVWLVGRVYKIYDFRRGVENGRFSMGTERFMEENMGDSDKK